MQEPGLLSSVLSEHLLFDLIVSAVLTWPLSLLLLGFYSRAVRRTMRTSVRATAAPSTLSTHVASAGRATLVAVDGEPATNATEMRRRLDSRPRRAALVYIVAGLVYATILGVLTLWSYGFELLPLRLSMFIVVYGWPAVIAVMVVSVTTRRTRVLLVAGYVAAIALIGALAMPASPDLTWTQVFLVWLISALPPNLLLGAALSRRTRAVAPMVLTTVLFAMIGADVLITWIGQQDSRMYAAVTVGDWFGLGAVGTLAGMVVVGGIVFGVIGVLVAVLIRRGYSAKRMSDESLVLDTMWVFFSITFATDLSREGDIWALACVVALAAYFVVSRIGWRWLASREPESPAPTLLLLRSFSIGRDSERLFDALEKHWRRTGSIQMIAGADLNRRTVEPHETLDFLVGRLARRYVDGAQSLDLRLTERDLRRDADGRFRVNEFFCYDDTWKATLARLVADSTLVLMDLRGFSARNAGCVFELQELARQVSLDHVVFLLDSRTDEELLKTTLGPVTARVVRMKSGAPIAPVLAALAATTPVLSPATRLGPAAGQRAAMA